MTSSARPCYIIEHMEDLDADPNSPATFPQWALLEYRQMLKLVGPGSTVHFTGLISTASKEALHRALSGTATSSPASSSSDSLSEFEVHSAGILEMAQERAIALDDICLLDPKSPFPLSVSDARRREDQSDGKNADTVVAATRKGPFQYFLFGGILGDDPPRDRTGHLRAMLFPTRHLGSVQMTTDTALGVTKRVVEDGLALNLPGTESEGPGGAIEWVDHPELKFAAGESVSMPFRYMVEINAKGEKQPLMPVGMRDHIRRDLDRAFEF